MLVQAVTVTGQMTSVIIEADRSGGASPFNVLFDQSEWL
jgi:hypothetical protein